MRLFFKTRIFLLNFFYSQCGIGQVREQVKSLTREGKTPHPMGNRAGDVLLPVPIHWPPRVVILSRRLQTAWVGFL